MAFRKTARQQQIVKAARAVIFSKGVERLTTREIAHALKLTNGALYRHFKSKDEIISLLIDDIERTLLSAVRTAAVTETGPFEKLQGIFLSHLSYSEQMRGTSFTVINQVSGLKNKALKRKMLSVLNKYLKTIQEVIGQGIKTGIFKKDLDPASASVVFLGSVQSIVTLWCLGGYESSLRKSGFKGTLNIFKTWEK